MNKTLKFNSEEQNIFFTADQHFQHKNIIEFCNRPFKTVREMDHVLVSNWNAKVGEEDIIFVLGDFCWGSNKSWSYLLQNLNGKKYLIIGNHDKNVSHRHWVEIDHIMNLFIHDPEIDDGQRITLCHYPMLSWYQSHRGAWQLYGHLHGKLTNNNLGDGKYDIKNKVICRQLDVGVDPHNFTPLSYEEVKTIITKQCLKRI